MEQKKFSLSEFGGAPQVDVDVTLDYSDEDIVMIDNAKFMANPNPVKLQMNIVAFCNQGKIQGILNGVTSQFSKNQLLICPPGTIITDFMLSPDFEFKAIMISNRMLQSFLREKMNVWTELHYIDKQHVITLEEEDIQTYIRFYDMLNGIVSSSRPNEYRAEVVQSMLRGALLHLCGTLNAIKAGQTIIQPKVSQAGTLFQQFIDMLNATPVKHRPVEWYAGELCITPKYLSTICKNHSGKTANEWITEHVVEDIRYYLKQSDYSIKQICDLLGFPNPSFFGKYVKEHFGMTPVQIRMK